MVLYKRKPVSFREAPQKIDNNTEIWVIPKSKEIFTDYESYLKRYDFLTQKKFTDAVNGKSGMTFFDALDSESNSSNDIDKIFPEALRDPILRKVQFSDIPRIDELVTYVYEEFRGDYFPGEEVSIVLDNGDNLEGVIREKAKFPELRNMDGSLRRAAFSRYFVRLKNQGGEEALLDDSHVKRGRNVFTKQNLRAYLKNSLQREAWTGAPWLVKEYLAVQYRLPMEIPQHLQQAAKTLEQKQSQSSQPRTAAHFNSVKGRKGTNLTPHDFSMEQMDGQQVQQIQAAQGTYDLAVSIKQEPPKITIPIKYPIEDLDIAPSRNGSTRPRLSFIAPQDGTTSPETGLQMAYVGPLLEVWNTLNVQCEIYQLDSFTFDDFVDAMKFSSDELSCELFEETHCAVLKQLVDEEGEVQVTLPDMIEDEDSEEEDTPDESEPTTPMDVPALSTRSRLSQVENMSDQEVELTPSENRQRPHRAPELFTETNWVDRLKARNFAHGGWQVIVVGLLYQLSLDARHKESCEAILAQLVPLDEEPSLEMVRQRYVTLNVNLRISVLEIITLLSLTTKAVRSFLESCSEDMTATRKIKLDHQKARKEAWQQIVKLTDEARLKNPDRDAIIEETSEIKVALHSDVDDTLETNGAGASDPEDDETASRALRRGTDRAGERKRKRDEETARKEKERLEKAEAAKESNKQSKEYKKILKSIDERKALMRKCEEDISVCDRDLREANCQRTKVLGRDRFWNRYYWFERNGMPFGGLPSSSTAADGYANARIWVQGPDSLERAGFIDLPQEDMDKYYGMHKLTVPERKTLEEGSTNLQNASEWGYYDDPDSIDALIGWLDERGRREKDLRKELTIWREDIVTHMNKLKEHLEGRNKKDESIEEHPTRVSTRHKTYAGVSLLNEKCLKWSNTTAVRALRHIHSEQSRPKEKRAKVEKREGKGVATKVSAKNIKTLATRTTRSGKA